MCIQIHTLILYRYVYVCTSIKRYVYVKICTHMYIYIYVYDNYTYIYIDTFLSCVYIYISMSLSPSLFTMLLRGRQLVFAPGCFVAPAAVRQGDRLHKHFQGQDLGFWSRSAGPLYWVAVQECTWSYHNMKIYHDIPNNRVCKLWLSFSS